LLCIFLPICVFAGVDEIKQALREGQFSTALELCNQEISKQPDNAQLWMWKGFALQNMGQPKEALSAYRKTTHLNPRLLPALEAEAQIEYQMGDPAGKATLEKIVAIKPDSAPAHGMLGVLAYEQKQCAAAVGHFEKAGALNQNAAALWQFGNCLYELQRPVEAAAAFQKMLSIKDHDLVRYNLGLSLLAAKQPAEAVVVLSPLAEREKPDFDLLSLLAAAYEADKQTPKALATLRRAAELDPLQERHYIDFASICMEHSSLDLGVEVLEVGTRNIPTSARLHATLGALLVRSGNTEKAQREFATAQTLDPKAAYGNIGLSLALLQADRIDDSIHLLRTQLTRNPNNSMATFMLAQALLRAGTEPGKPEFAEAQKLLKQTVALEPNSARAHGLLGKNYAQAGDLKNATRELETALRLDSSDRTSAYQLALLYGRTGQEALAAKWQQRVRDLIVAEQKAEKDQNRFLIVRAPPQRTVTQ
jgi:tetratricopeptide (TPR) repeat protein